MTRISVVIPAYNEEEAIAKVIAEIPSTVQEVVVVNNNSTVTTVAVAKAAGATVLSENRKGYGYACLKGLDYLRKNDTPDIVVFLDGDYSDHPEELTQLVEPITSNKVDFVVGARVKEKENKAP